MTEMKTLTVNGKTYTIADPDAAHIDDAVIGDGAWSSKNIIDRLCPAFTRSGAAVRCQPVEGYPLQVTTLLPASQEGYTGITLRLTGKNLYDKDSYPLESFYIGWADGVKYSSTGFVSTNEKYLPVSELRGKAITLNHCPNDKSPNTRAGMAFYEETDGKKVYISGTNLATMTVPENATHMRFSVPNEYADGTDVQLELGTEITAYEPYRSGVTVTAELTEPAFGSYQWPPLAALPGTNTIYSSAGETTVTGRADLIAILQTLTGE